MQNRDLSAFEKIGIYHRLWTEGRTVEEIAKLCGASKAEVRIHLRLSSLPEPLLDSIRQGDLSTQVAIAFTNSSNKTDIMRAFEMFKKNKSVGAADIRVEMGRINYERYTFLLFMAGNIFFTSSFVLIALHMLGIWNPFLDGPPRPIFQMALFYFISSVALIWFTPWKYARLFVPGLLAREK